MIKIRTDKINLATSTVVALSFSFGVFVGAPAWSAAWSEDGELQGTTTQRTKSKKSGRHEAPSGETVEGPLGTMGALAEALPDYEDDYSDGDYNSRKEYERHQVVSERFFRKLSRKPDLRAVIDRFKEEVVSGGGYTRIIIDGLSSRSRIFLFRELTTHSLARDLRIPFSFLGKQFDLQLMTDIRQPGSGIITEIGSYDEIFGALSALSPEEQKEVANKLLAARQTPYHLTEIEPIEGVDLNMLNILLDFEVARRLQGTPKEEGASVFAKSIKDDATRERHREFCRIIKENQEAQTPEWVTSRKIRYMHGDKRSHDAVPVASAVIGAFKLSTSETPSPYCEFFHATDSVTVSGSVFPHGPLNAFQGEVDLAHREKATREIIKRYRGARTAREERIRREYLEVFGGRSESTTSSADEGASVESSHSSSDGVKPVAVAMPVPAAKAKKKVRSGSGSDS